jgi:hypothetical protein
VAQRVYSHSTVIFNYQGKQYTLRFSKWRNIDPTWSELGQKKMD